MKTLLFVCCIISSVFIIASVNAEPVKQSVESILKTPENQLPNRLLLDVDGIVCSFCAHGVKKKLSQLAFIDKSQYTDGIYVDIDQQQVLVAIKLGSTADVEAAFQAVRDGGYDPLRACVTNSEGKLDCIDATKKS